MVKGREGLRYLDQNLMRLFGALPIVKLVIVLLLLYTMALLILRAFKIKSVRGSRGVRDEIRNVEAVRDRDRAIIRNNKILKKIKDRVEASPLKLPKQSKDYYQYNIERANIKGPGGMRYLAAEEFNALTKTVALGLMAVSIVTAVIVNAALGVMLMILTVVGEATLPMIVLRSIVAQKDGEIRENFSDFYLMVHHPLVRGGDTPLDRLMRSYAKTTSSKEMLRFVDNCTGHIETHGEYSATRYIARDYREIHEVNKLMRLVRHLHAGGNVQQELIGFRQELINERGHIIEKNSEKLIFKARASFNVLIIVLIQAIISAMAIYAPDLMKAGSLFGGK